MLPPNTDKRDNWYSLSGRLLVLAAVFSLIAAVLLQEAFRTPRAEMTLLVAGQSGASMRSLPTLVALTKTERFRDRLIDRSSLAATLLEEVLPSAGVGSRRTLIGAVEFTQVPDSDLVLVSATAPVQSDARDLVRESAKAFFELSSSTYEGAGALTVRALNGPITTTQITSPVLYTAASILFGLAAAGLVLLAAIGVRRVSERLRRVTVPHRRRRRGAGFFQTASPHRLTRDVFVPRRPSEIFSVPSDDRPTPEEERLRTGEPKQEDWYEKIASIIETPEAVPPFARSPLAGARGAAPEKEAAPAYSRVPQNLPTADVSALGIEFTTTEKEKEPAAPLSDTMETAPIADTNPANKTRDLSHLKREPSVEEYRRRLNELLSSGR